MRPKAGGRKPGEAGGAKLAISARYLRAWPAQASRGTRPSPPLSGGVGRRGGRPPFPKGAEQPARAGRRPPLSSCGQCHGRLKALNGCGAAWQAALSPPAILRACAAGGWFREPLSLSRRKVALATAIIEALNAAPLSPAAILPPWGASGGFLIRKIIGTRAVGWFNVRRGRVALGNCSCRQWVSVVVAGRGEPFMALRCGGWTRRVSMSCPWRFGKRKSAAFWWIPSLRAVSGRSVMVSGFSGVSDLFFGTQCTFPALLLRVFGLLGTPLTGFRPSLSRGIPCLTLPLIRRCFQETVLHMRCLSD